MKKHAVILCGIYYPQPSATGQCAMRYAKLIKDEYDISVVFIQSDNKPVEITDSNGFNIYSICGKRLEAEYKSTGIKKSFLHLIGKIEIKLFPLGNLNWYKKQALKKLEQINKKRKIDVIFSVCSPLAAHAAGNEFKKKHINVRHAAYTVDLYASRKRVRPFYMSYNKLVEYEKRIISEADCFMPSEEIYKTKAYIRKANNNCTILPYVMPELQVGTEDKQVFPKDEISCVYAGRFYEKIRNPEYMLRLFSNKKNTAVLHLYSVGCEELVDKYAKKSKNIVIHDLVSSEEIKKIYSQADILIGIGNTEEELLPSKTYEYISARKPITFFNPIKDNDILNKYPLCIQINHSEQINCAVERFAEFSREVKGENVLQSEIEAAYEDNFSYNVKKILIREF